jgi:hypothetical protein
LIEVPHTANGSTTHPVKEESFFLNGAGKSFFEVHILRGLFPSEKANLTPRKPIFEKGEVHAPRVHALFIKEQPRPPFPQLLKEEDLPSHRERELLWGHALSPRYKLSHQNALMF